MNILRKIFAILIATACAPVFCGCSTTITHEYSHYISMSTDEAIRLLFELSVPSSLVSDAGYSSITADQAGFDWKTKDKVIDKTVIITPAGPGVRGVSQIWYHYKTNNYHIAFAEIVGIKMDKRPALIPILGAPSTYHILLECNGHDRNWHTHVSFHEHPDKYNEYLSAFLVLCPNVN